MASFSAIVVKIVSGVAIMAGIGAGSVLMVGDGIDTSSPTALTVGSTNATSISLAKPVTFGSTVTLPAGAVPLGGSVVTGTLPAANQAAQAASTLTGSTLASGVTASSLTSVGTLANLTVTNPISGSVAGNASTVTTNANLTGDVTSSGNATTLAASTVTGKALTGFVSGAGTVSSSDTILSCVDKLDGNIALKAPIASPTFTGTATIPTLGGSSMSLANSLTSITATGPTSDVVPGDLTITAQAPWSSASTNKVAGNIKFNLPAPISGTTFSEFGIQQSGTDFVRYVSGPTGTGTWWLGANAASPTASNFQLQGSSGVTYINSAANIYFAINASSIAIWSSTQLQVSVPTVVFANSISSPTITQAALSTNGATAQPLAIQAQNESGTGATVGGELDLIAGTGATPGAVSVQGPIAEGYFAQAMADTAQTVSAANSRNNLFVATGANTAVRAITLTRAPKAGTMVFIRDNCTGNGITVQFATGAATGTIAPATSALVTSDGTNAVVLMTGT